MYLCDYRYRYALLVICQVFFFKQKTAYEMRISDWSSDLCSSDLLEDIIVADSQLVPKNVAVTPGVRVAHLSCSEFLAGQNITVVVLRQTNRHIDGNLGFDQQQTKRVVIRNQFKSFNLAICDCFAISCQDRKSTRLNSSH